MTARAFLLVVLLATLPAGCAFGRSSQPAGTAKHHRNHAAPRDTLELVRLATYRGHGITFRYPASWRYRRRGFRSMMTSPVVDLATQPTRNPCFEHRCWFPVRHLRPGGVVAMWEIGGGMIDPAYRPAPGIRVKILRGGCRALGGEEELLARLVLRGGRIYDAAACLRGPGLVEHDREVRLMFASATRLG